MRIDIRIRFRHIGVMRRAVACNFLALALVSIIPCQAQDATLSKLADDFWTWRAKYAPFTADDVNRIERPGGIRDWSRTAIERRGKELTEFEARWKKIDASGWPIPRKVARGASRDGPTGMESRGCL